MRPQTRNHDPIKGYRASTISAMKVIAPVRMKRRRAPGTAEPPDNSPPDSQPAAGELLINSPPAPGTPESREPSPPPHGLIRKSAVRKFLKQDFALPFQVREAFFAAIEAKLARPPGAPAATDRCDDEDEEGPAGSCDATHERVGALGAGAAGGTILCGGGRFARSSPLVF
jgi:hypothetical protein